MSAAIMIEICAALAGVAGTWLLARKGPRAGWGFVAYLASNAGWILFAWLYEHWGLLLQQVAFTAVSLYGIWTWLVTPMLDKAVGVLDDITPAPAIEPGAVRRAIAALQGRAERGLDAATRHQVYCWWSGYKKALEDLASGVGHQLAAKDALRASPRPVSGAGASEVTP